MRRRRLLALAGGLMGMGLAAACAPGSPQPSPGGAPATSSAASDTAATSTGAPSGTAQGPSAAQPGGTAPVASVEQAGGTAQPASAGQASGQPKSGGALQIGTITDITQLEGHRLQGQNWNMLYPIFDRLTEYDDKLVPQPKLAESWDFATDNKTLQIHIRPSVRFHTGRELASDDVKFNILRARDPKTGAAQMVTMGNWWSDIQTPDKNTVVLVSEQPRPAAFDFLEYLNIIDPVTAQGPNAATTLVGSGPFSLGEWVTGDHLSLKKNPRYWQSGAPYLDEITFHIGRDQQALITQLEAGAIDAMDAPPITDAVRLKSDPAYSLAVNANTGGYNAVLANTSVAPLDNKQVRQALNCAINRQRYVDTVLHGVGTVRRRGRRFGDRNPQLIRDLVDAGYAYVNSEVRGRGGSEGEWRPEQAARVEGPDGYDTIEWLAAQRWCDSNVGMIGASHMAAMQYFAALEQPPHLRAIAPWTGGGPGSGGSGFRPPRSGGVMSFITTLVWLPNEGPGVLDNLEREEHDVSRGRALLAGARTDPAELYNYLPLLEHPLANEGRLGELFRWRVQTPAPGPVANNPDRWSRVQVPCFHECRWYDAVNWAELENFTNLQVAAGTSEARDGQHIVCGPWQHGMQFQPVLGDVYFGEAASNQGSGLHALQIAFFDRYVRGQSEVQLPRVRYFVMGANEWRDAEVWPPASASARKLYLHSAGGANSVHGDGALDWSLPESELADAFIYDPHRPVQTVGGAMIGAVTGPGILVGPIEQSRVEARPDVLCYTSALLADHVEISGPIVAHLWVATSAVDTDFTGKLTHVYPDGQSYNLAEGILRLSGRHLDGQPSPVAPGAVYPIEITLGHTSVLVRAGFRLRLQVSSSSFPQYDRNMNTGNPIGTDAVGVRALQTVYHDTEHPSHVEVPVVEANHA